MADLPERVSLVIFDLDGVVYRGNEPIAGARELVEWLHARGVAVRFATNNSMVSRAGYVERLGGMGISTSEEEIVTSTSATIEHLRRHAPDVRSVLAIGADGMRQELADAGLDVVMADAVASDHPGGPLPQQFDAVIVGLDPGVDYARLSAAMSAVAAGARLIATNADARYPTPAGFLPGAGAIVAALATATAATPEVIGKPAPAMFSATVEASGVPASETVVVGDNPDADVVGAHRAGCAAILVLTGVADREAAAALEGERRPEAIADDPEGVRALLAARVNR
ncbi:MAG TPA: HAD-IIA family hydrolase [Candidatus Limnocylindria bacterium]|nr:HAD-IIA family hydrolase [Candidatus Limnocylindria bacterium]